MRLVDSCIAATGRTYPAGYGFALTYLTDNPGPDHFRAMQAAAWKAVKPQAMLGNADAPAFVAGFAKSKQHVPNLGWRWWLIEAAQLVLAEALRGNAGARAVMRLWDHPGY